MNGLPPLLALSCVILASGSIAAGQPPSSPTPPKTQEKLAAPVKVARPINPFRCSFINIAPPPMVYTVEESYTWHFEAAPTTEETYAKVKVTLALWTWDWERNEYAQKSSEDREYENVSHGFSFDYTRTVPLAGDQYYSYSSACYLNEQVQPLRYSCKFRVTADVRYQKVVATTPTIPPRPGGAPPPDPWKLGGHCQNARSFQMPR